MAKMIHGYWEIRGLGQPIRLLLAYKQADIEDKRYYTGPAPDYDKSQWLNEKFNLGFDFPNLPYLVDGDVKLTQTHAIMRYLARKYDLEGSSELERRRADLAEQQLVDLRGAFVGLCYSPDHAQKKPAFLAQLATALKAFSAFLGKHKWFAGERITFVDFLIYEVLFQLSVFSKESFKGSENLLEFLKRFEQLPTIAAYMKSDKFIKWPFNNNMAAYGSRSTECPF